MGTYILMRILESAPGRYDKGIRILTLGQLDRVYDRLTSHIKRGQKVLDIGCGTGALALRAAAKGAKVKGIDVNPRMLEIAGKRVRELDLEQDVELCEMGAAELGSEGERTYDIVMSGLCFSELTEDELNFTLKEVRRVLKPGGLLLAADEVIPTGVLKKMLSRMIRVPLLIITYIITQTTTHPIASLPEKIRKAGFRVEAVRTNRLGNFMELIGRSP